MTVFWLYWQFVGVCAGLLAVVMPHAISTRRPNEMPSK